MWADRRTEELESWLNGPWVWKILWAVGLLPPHLLGFRRPSRRVVGVRLSPISHPKPQRSAAADIPEAHRRRLLVSLASPPPSSPTRFVTDGCSSPAAATAAASPTRSTGRRLRFTEEEHRPPPLHRLRATDAAAASLTRSDAFGNTPFPPLRRFVISHHKI